MLSCIFFFINDFSNKKNNMKELIVNSVLCIIDVALVTIGLIMIFGF